MSQQNLGNNPQDAKPPVAKQRLNVYTVMLIVSFIAICTACVLLYLELSQYGAYPWWKVDQAIGLLLPSGPIEAPWFAQNVCEIGKSTGLIA